MTVHISHTVGGLQSMATRLLLNRFVSFLMFIFDIYAYLYRIFFISLKIFMTKSKPIVKEYRMRVNPQTKINRFTHIF